MNIEYEGLQYVGSNLYIACTVHLSSVVDIDVNTDIEWLQDGLPVKRDGERIAVEIEEMNHKSTISFSPLIALDNGTLYTCIVKVSPFSSPNVIGSTTSANITLTIIEGR